MSIKTYKSTDKTQLTTHFNIQEFRCKCGGNHDIKLDTDLADKLEKLHTAMNCSKIIINSGYRCSSHDRNVGGSGAGQLYRDFEIITVERQNNLSKGTYKELIIRNF